MSTESPDQQPESGATPPPPPPADQTAGYQAPPPPAGQAPGYQAPPPGGYQAPPPGGYQGAPTAYGGPAAPLSDSDQRMWAMLGHLGGILFYFLAPLIIWLVFRERGRYVEEQSKEALNFQLTLLIAWVVGWITTAIFIGFLLLAAAGIVSLVFSIIAAIAANKGEPYRYPIAIRFIK